MHCFLTSINSYMFLMQYGLPDESCQLYNATDHTKFGTEKRTT